MALLQIAEPGQSAAPHQHKRAVGIDLGTTNSLVAAVRSGQADTLSDEQGRDLLPSVVHYQAGQADAIRVGFDAKREAALDPHNTIVSVKRMMGKALADMDTRQQPYEFVAADNGMPQIQTRQGLVNPVQVSA
ncbi:MAG: Hsp70 family protein, partial [Aeromonas sp.]|nr:Hsp70 family protein [Aeromonas sp.]MBP8079977.1 Hsp70 family protein [Aeromonas sp.]MBP8153256.1 Hsp70 family protein [Aeromonas sp.]